MDCRDELEFNDNGSKRMEKANESILLMKKKMFRSHDLILQYNNKLKECDRLKGDLNIVQEEAARFKQDNNTNLTKVLRLEMQSTDIKKKNKELEEKISEQNIRIASDKSHVEQLICKLKNVEDQHSIKLMEIDLQKSSLEGKVKELEQELKALKKSHLAEIKKLEKAKPDVQKSPKSKHAVSRIKPLENIPVETKEIGVNTIQEPVPIIPAKPLTLEKSTLTNDFYHIKDNPYPIFCDKCESLMQPSADKICRIMTNHPILLTEMTSPPRKCVSERFEAFNKSNCDEPKRINLNFDGPHSVDLYGNTSNHMHQIRDEAHYDDLRPSNDVILNRNNLKHMDLIHVETNSQNSTSASIVHKNVSENCASSVTVTTPEIMKLRRQLAKLERKVKIQSKKKALELQQPNASCCGHSRTVNCCGHGVNHINTIPNVFPNVQPDLMSDFFKKMMKFVKERTPKRESPRKRNKRCIVKPLMLKKQKITVSKKKTKSCGSTKSGNWEIESDDCQTKEDLCENIGNSSTEEMHILRIKPSKNIDIQSADMSLNDSNKLCLDKVPWETSISESSAKPNRIDEIVEESNENKSVTNSESLINVSNPPVSRRGRKKRERVEYLFSEDDSMEVESNDYEKITETNSVQTLRRTSSRIQNRCLRTRENAKKRIAIEESVSSCSKTNLNKLAPDISKPVAKFMSTSPDDVFEDLESVDSSRHSKIKPISVSPSADSKNFDLDQHSSAKFVSTASTNLKDSKVSTNLEMDNLSHNLPANKSASTLSKPILKDLKSEDHSDKLPIIASTLVSSNTDLKNTELETSTQHLTIDKSDAISSDENLSDALLEDDLSQSPSDLEAMGQMTFQEQVNTKKRKRGTAKVTKRSSRSKLFGKLRALRKNSVLTVTSIASHKTNTELHSISKCKENNASEVEEPKDKSKENNSSSLSGSESDCHVPAKKQRIAHIAKNIADVKFTDRQVISDKEEENMNNEICDKKSTDKLEPGCNIETQQRPVTRRLTNNRSQVNNVPVDEKTSDSTGLLSAAAVTEYSNPSYRRLPVSVIEVCKQARVQPRRNLSTNSSLVSNSTPKTNNSTTTSADSGRSWLSSPKQKVAPLEASPVTSCLGLSLPVFSPDSSTLESPDVEISSVVVHRSPELKLKECNVILERSDSSNDSKTSEITAESPKTSKIQRKFIRVDFVKSTDVGDSKTADVHTPESMKNHQQDSKVILEESVKLSELRITNDTERNQVKSQTSPKHSKKIIQLDRNFYKAKTLNSKENTNVMGTSGQFNNSSDSAFSTNTLISPTLESSAKVAKKLTQNILSPNQSPNSLRNDLVSCESSVSPDTAFANSSISPVSPESSPGLPGVVDFMPDLETYQAPLSIYENVTIEIPGEVSTALQTASNSSPQSETSQRDHSNCDKISTDMTPITATADKIASKPAVDRKSLVYDMSFLESSFEETDPDFEDSNSQRNCKKMLNRNSCISRINTNKDYVVKELRTRQVLTSPVEIVNPPNEIQKCSRVINEEAKSKALKDPKAYQRRIRDLGTLLNRYITEEKKKTVNNVTKYQIQCATALQEEDEKTVKAALEKLVDSEEWTSNVHQSVIETLRGISSGRTIAKAIIDFLTESADHQEPLDRTYTPPAPVMTKTQQRIITLINSLEQSEIVSNIFQLVQAGIEFTVFKLRQSQEMDVLEYLIRIYAVMARAKKDRERLRILCCDILYCYSRASSILIYTVLTIWLEVFPMYDDDISELPICLAHLIRKQQNAEVAPPRSMILNRLLNDYYHYPAISKPSAELVKSLLQTLKNNYTIEIETAVLLIAKHEGTDWAYKNIVNGGLMQMITDNSCQSIFNVLNLLGFILRSFPFGNEAVAKVTSQLCSMIDSGEGSPDHQEGIVSALLSLSRHITHFNKIQNSVLKWKPSRTLRPTTIEKLDAFFRMRKISWWTNQKSKNYKREVDSS